MSASNSASRPTARFDTIAIIGKHGDAGATDLLRELADFLASRGHRVVFEAGTAPEGGARFVVRIPRQA